MKSDLKKSTVSDGLVALILLVVIGAAFGNSIRSPFYYDDIHIIVENPGISKLINLRYVFNKEKYFQLFGENSYRPVTTITYILLHQVCGKNPALWRLFNLVIHLVNCFLLYLVLRRTQLSEWLALLAVTIFAAHTLHTEIINVISYNEDLIGSLFCLLALLWYFKEGWGWKLASVMLYFLACLTKETFILLPLMFFFFEWWGDEREFSWSGFFGRVAGYLIVAIIILLINFVLMKNPNPTGLVSYPGGSLVSALLTFSVVLIYYLKLTFLPLGLTPVYIFKIQTSFFNPTVLSSMAILLLIAGMIIYGLVKRERYALYLIWFFLFILPTSNIIPFGAILSEHYLYFPLMGLIPGILLLVNFGLVRLKLDWQKPAFGVGIIILLILCLLTIRRNVIWNSQVSLWSDTQKKAPDSIIPLGFLASHYYSEKDYQNAIKTYNQVVARMPMSYPSAYYFLAKSHQALGDLSEARKNYEKAVTRKAAYNNINDYYQDLSSLAKLCYQTADYEAAYKYWKQLAIYQPNNPAVYLDLSLVSKRLGMTKEADEFMKRHNALKR